MFFNHKIEERYIDEFNEFKSSNNKITVNVRLKYIDELEFPMCIDSFMNKLSKYKNEFSEFANVTADVEIEDNYDSCASADITLYGEREETDSEFDIRMRSEFTSKLNRRIADLKTYEALKVKLNK